MIGVIIPNKQLTIGVTARVMGYMDPLGGNNESIIPLHANPKKNTIKQSLIRNDIEVM